MSSYDALASSYDGLMADGSYRKRADWLDRLFRKSRIPVHSVLDLACGTGTIACLLAQRGYEVIATDGSEEMLTQAVLRLLGVQLESMTEAELIAIGEQRREESEKQRDN